MSAPRVHNRHHGTAPADAVYVGRGTPWGNPFKDGNRAENIGRFRQWVDEQPHYRQQMRDSLAGKHLVCSCAPLPCHADVILEIANAESDRIGP